jgi:hypothetical protein
MYYKVELTGVDEPPLEPEKGDGETINFSAEGDTSVDYIIRQGIRSIIQRLNSYGKDVKTVNISRATNKKIITDDLVTGVRTVIFLKRSPKKTGNIPSEQVIDRATGDTEEFGGEDFPSN